MKDTPDILKTIVARKKEEVEALKSSGEISPEEISDLPDCLGFHKALKSGIERSPLGVSLIAEIKKASPSKGVIRADFDPDSIARAYEEGGASCLSILTDQDFFQGSLNYLKSVREFSSLPIIRKDFIIDPIQIFEARLSGADAILLIAACLQKDELAEFHEIADDIGLDTLIEVHTEEEWIKVAESISAPKLVGVNNRNLHDFSVSLETFERLSPEIAKSGATLVAESGIYTPDDVKRLKKAGATAILVGESLMRQPEVLQATRQLLAIN